MSAPRKLVLFAAIVGLVLGVAALAGAAISPDTETDSAGHADADAEAPGHDTAGAKAHGDEAPAATEDDAAAGLAVAENGYRLVPEGVRLEPGRPERFEFRVLGPDGEPVREFEAEHEREMHLIVVRRDTAHYRHLHPTLGAGGTWRAKLQLPAAGVYRAYADFRIEGERRTLATALFAPGELRPEPLPAPSRAATADGYDVSLASGGLAAGEPAALTFQVSRRGEPVSDLQPYLGALGHLVALREGDLAYVHVHPEEESEGGGDEIAFAAEFPTAGRYRLFLQFRHEGRVPTVDYTLEVPR